MGREFFGVKYIFNNNQALPSAYGGKIQFQNVENPDFFVFHDKQKFVVGEKSGRRFVHSAPAKFVKCPVKIKKWFVRYEGKFS